MDHNASLVKMFPKIQASRKVYLPFIVPVDSYRMELTNSAMSFNELSLK
jgi:hypothetical protein